MNTLLPILLCGFAFAAHAEPTELAALQAAAERGDTVAMLRLGSHLQKQRALKPAAMQWFLRAAEAGSVEAQYHLAQSHLNGTLGPVDTEAAEYWYGRVREQGVCPSTIRAPDAL